MRRITLAMLAAAAIVAAALPATAGGGGGCLTASPVSAPGTTVGMARNCFTPAVLWVNAGTTVRFVNDDIVPHQVLGWPGGLGTDTLEQGMSYEFAFTAAGVYPYACWLHPGMTGVVIVGSPQRPSSAVSATSPGVPGEIRGPDETAKTPVAAKSTDAGAVGGAAALAGAAAGTIGFAVGRRRRELP